MSMTFEVFKYKREEKKDASGKPHVVRKLLHVKNPEKLTLFHPNVTYGDANSYHYLVILALPNNPRDYHLLSAYVYQILGVVKQRNKRTGEQRLVGYKVRPVIVDATFQEDIKALLPLMVKESTALSDFARHPEFQKIVLERLTGAEEDDETTTEESKQPTQWLSRILPFLRHEEDDEVYVATVGFQEAEAQQTHNAIRAVARRWNMNIIYGSVSRWEDINYLRDKHPVAVLFNGMPHGRVPEKYLPLYKAVGNRNLPSLVIHSNSDLSESNLRQVFMLAAPQGIAKIFSSTQKRIAVLNPAGYVGKTFIALTFGFYVAGEGVASAVVDVGQRGLSSLVGTVFEKKHLLPMEQIVSQDASVLDNYQPYRVKLGKTGTYLINATEQHGTDAWRKVVAALHGHGIPVILFDTQQSVKTGTFRSLRPLLTDIIVPISSRVTARDEMVAFFEELAADIASGVLGIETGAGRGGEQRAQTLHITVAYNNTQGGKQATYTADVAKQTFYETHLPVFTQAFQDHIESAIRKRAISKEKQDELIKRIFAQTRNGAKFISYAVIPHVRTVPGGNTIIPIAQEEDRKKVINPLFEKIYRTR